MKKNNTKVELKKYLSQKEKIKNTFISSCIIIVVLTFFIFITYSYFIEKTGEIDVGNVQAAIPEYDVVVENKEIVENTNNQKAIITIKNNSLENYSYNLNFEENENCKEIYYDITGVEYSHPKGIIKPSEEKKIYLISRSGCNINSLNLKLDTGYEYSPIKISNGYKEISYLYKSNSQQEHETDLIALWADYYGELSPSFDTEITEYEMYVNRDDLEAYGGSGIEITFNSIFSNDGYITGEKVQINEEGTIKHEIKVYTNDGKYIQTYIINIHVVEFYTGKIKSFKLIDKCAERDEFGDYPIIASAYNAAGFENGEKIIFKNKLPTLEELNYCSDNNIHWNLYFEFLDGDISRYNVSVVNYNGYDLWIDDSNGERNYVEFIKGRPEWAVGTIYKKDIRVRFVDDDHDILVYSFAYAEETE